jgi:hypothetical protein
VHSGRQIPSGCFSMPRLRTTSIVEPDTSRRIYQRHGYIKQIKPTVGERAVLSLRRKRASVIGRLGH